ncbi:hypothetical protein [Dyella sp. AD56]|uniref:hypothetical protein n=1 Tax=Dyella sp. AD56 TaxID=1528744 RepID=UPI0011AEDBD3|nr:hypothetical protein [Dyella sp. AD56]
MDRSPVALAAERKNARASKVKTPLVAASEVRVTRNVVEMILHVRIDKFNERINQKQPHERAKPS